MTVVWNNIDGLIATCQSVREQSYAQYEHIIVDGASVDGTQMWAANYALDQRVTFISEPDNGIFDAMNRSLTRVSGQIVVFMNGGDKFYDSHTLRVVAESWDAEEWSWAYGGVEYVDKFGNFIERYMHDPFRRRNIEFGLKYVPHQSTYASLDVLRNLGGFREEFGTSSDQELIVRLAGQCEPKVFDQYLSKFLSGGAHSKGTMFERAKRYHAIRRENGCLLLSNRIADRAFSFAEGFWWSIRAALAKYIKRKPVL
ncbi:glycosyltransferase family 2 protein [Rhodococcus jostii]|uniref:glycosyltransferase family 2 protein n=1 Tax=Rhodococcus jostii TaxID=132919 RepID=UPI0013C3184B|nr:glycosyltransferase family 2 protein [Rhodococcus jostii]